MNPSPSLPPLRLDAPIQYLRGVGPRFAQLFAARGIETVGQLLRFLPRRYQGRQAKHAIRDLEPAMVATVEGRVIGQVARRIRGRTSLEVIVGDGTGALSLVWFSMPGRGSAERFKKGVRLRVSGQVKRFRDKLQMTHPETTVLDGTEVLEPPSDSVAPIYTDVEGMRPAQLRRVIAAALPSADRFVEVLPAPIQQRRELPPIAECIRSLHAPPADADVVALDAMTTPWHRRLIYEELFMLQLAVLSRKAAGRNMTGCVVPLRVGLCETAARLYPFALTQAQQRCLDEIEADLRQAIPMSRLLQGDVGSGKTAVALSAAAAVAQAGMQAAVMAPTELLAEQHARTASKILTPVGIEVALLTGSTSGGDRREILGRLDAGDLKVVVGTHALIQEGVSFASLGLGIVDEQHRFGVAQRRQLTESGQKGCAKAPHILVMTATPIPRTLALTVYGDLDVSVIDELPPGRSSVRTVVYRDLERDQAYRRLKQAVQAGRQAYVVFPLVSESQSEALQGLRDAVGAAEELAAGALTGLRIGLLHGRMDSCDKDRVMQAFASGEVQVLVATTVVEVGIDVPNATVMLIEHAERFGLSQLHQLRGRVGRGTHKSECLLVARCRASEDAWRRLTIMERTTDGFRIAEEDLALRGPGDFLGTRQSGVPMLSIAELVRDRDLLLAAREDAGGILRDDPELRSERHAVLRAHLETSWRANLALAQIA